jgi:hypothetical protein
LPETKEEREEVKIEDNTLQLADIFGTYGEKVKKESQKYTLYYDFKPYNPDEPILLAL